MLHYEHFYWSLFQFANSILFAVLSAVCPFNKFIIWIIVFFISRNFTWLFKILILWSFSYFHQFSLSFSFLEHISHNFLMSSFDNSNMWVTYGPLFIDCVFSWCVRSYSPGFFLACLVFFDSMSDIVYEKL